METANRISYFDFLRGIAILMVIGIHTYIIRPFDGITNIVQIGLRDCLTFAVPLFLAISGFFLGQKDLLTKANYLRFLGKQLSRVYMPAVLWSLPIVALWVCQGQTIGTSIFKGLMCMSFGPYYYVILIIQFYVLLPIIKRMADRPVLGGGILLILNIVALVVYNRYVPSSELPTVLSVGPFIYWVVFYYIGILLSDKKREYTLAIPISLLIVGIISMIAYLFLYHKGVGIKVSSWIYSAGMILLLFSSKIENKIGKDTIFYKKMVEIGRFSFGIYLLHVYIVLIWQHILPIGNWLISFVTVTILSVISVTFLRKLIPLKYWKLLGLN